MARGKHSIALFEVITAGRAHERHGSPLSRRARWWFQRPAMSRGGMKSSQSVAVAEDAPTAPIMREVDGPTAEEIAADPTLRPISSPMRITPAAPAPALAPVVVETPAVSEPVYTPQPEPAPEVAEASEEPSPGPVVQMKPSRFGSKSGLDVQLNPDRQEVTLRMRYTTGIIAGFAVLVIVGLAYVAGRSTGKTPALAAGTASTDQIRKGPVHPTVLNVGGRSDEPTIQKANIAAANLAQHQTTRATPGGKAVPPEKNTKPVPVSQDPIPTQPGAIEQMAQRSIGLNYVLVQSYSDAEEAGRAVELLRQAGVQSTVERGLPIAPGKYCVVGTAGFASPFKNKPEYRQYLGAIDKVGNSLTPKSGVRRFEPMCFRWPGSGQG